MLYDPKIAHIDIRGFDVEGTTGKMGAKYKETGFKRDRFWLGFCAKKIALYNIKLLLIQKYRN